MPFANTSQSFGSLTRSLHWLTALLILTAMPLGLYANSLPVDTAAAVAFKAQVFSVHKTIGVAAFFTALIRILAALAQSRPVPLHPDRIWETRAAEAVHWMLYISLLAVPLTGWIHHAAITGFAPILWPFGQTLPFVPKSDAVAQAASAAHWVFTKLLAAAILLHIAGAMKHHLIDRDSTLMRMLRGTVAPMPQPAKPKHSAKGPLLAALVIYAAGAGLAASLIAPPPVTAPQTATAPAIGTAQPGETSGNWQVTGGTLGFGITQMGAAVSAGFTRWTADITFQKTPVDGRHGQVAVSIDLASLALGAVTDQAKSADFLDVASHPTAIFTADIMAAGAAYEARGTLTLHGQTQPVTLPFTLEFVGDVAHMRGTLTLDRRDFAIGTGFADEATVGFAVIVNVDLTATPR